MVTNFDPEFPFPNPLPLVKAAYNAAYPSFPPTQRVASYAAPFVKGAVKSYLPGPLGDFAANLVPSTGDYPSNILARRSLVRSFARPISNYLANAASTALRSYSRPNMVRYTRRARGRRSLSFRRARRTHRSRTYRSNRATVPTPLPRAEVKFAGGSMLSLVTNHLGSIHPVSQVPKGTSDSDREGGVIRSVSFNLRSVFQANTTAIAAVNLRVILFKWLQGFSSPSVLNILENLPGAMINAPYKQSDARNYRVLYNQTHRSTSVSVGNAGTYAPVNKSFSITKRLNDVITYNGPGLGDADSGYYIILISDSPSSYNESFSYRFIDL